MKAQHFPVQWGASLSQISVKASEAVKLCLMLPKYYKTFDSPKYFAVKHNFNISKKMLNQYQKDFFCFNYLTKQYDKCLQYSIYFYNLFKRYDLRGETIWKHPLLLPIKRLILTVYWTSYFMPSGWSYIHSTFIFTSVLMFLKSFFCTQLYEIKYSNEI